MTRAERQEISALLALLRGLLRQGSAREALSILDSVRAGRAPHSAIARLATMLRRSHLTPEPTTPVQATTPVTCDSLQCELSAAECVRRQVKTDAQRTRQANRGQGPDHPHCDTRKCDQGRSVRERLDTAAPVEWRGAGPTGWIQRERSRGIIATQDAARLRLGRVGLLSPVPTVDGQPSRAEER